MQAVGCIAGTLEKDHADLDPVLDGFIQTVNRVIRPVQLDAPRARYEAGRLNAVGEKTEAFLARHPSDEEDLAVPFILHHRLRG